MSRLKRKNRTDILFKNEGGMLDLFDNAVKQSWYINDEEYDYICKNATDEEMDLFLGGDGKFSDLKRALKLVDKMIKDYGSR